MSRKDKKKGDYMYIGFYIPEGVTRIDVEYDYRPLGEGECVIDIGIFSPGNISFLNAVDKFRGWSGSNRKAFTICREYATPGYIPGEIPEGEWHIILGLYKIPEKGCFYTVKLCYSRGRCNYIAKKKIPPPTIKAGKKWIKGDLHIHSVHSDGDSTIDEVINFSKKAGLDFIAITDHNTISHLPELYSNNILVIPGEEVTTYRGHLNVLGIKEWVDFRIGGKEDILKLTKYVNSKGYLPIVNHPKPSGPPWELGHLDKIGFIEVWQKIWELNNHFSLKLWDSFLQKGRRIVAVGGSDIHFFKEGRGELERLALPTTWVYVDEVNVSSILESIRKGRVIITESIRGPFLDLKLVTRKKTCNIGEKAHVSKTSKAILNIKGGKGLILRLISRRGVILKEEVEEKDCTLTRDLQVSIDDVYLRAELLEKSSAVDELYSEENIIKALTNPIFLRVESN